MQILPSITRCNQLKMNARLAIELQNYIFVADALESCFSYDRILLAVWFWWVISCCDFKRNWNVFFLFAQSLPRIWFVALNCIWLLLISHNLKKMLLHNCAHRYHTSVLRLMEEEYRNEKSWRNESEMCSRQIRKQNLVDWVERMYWKHRLQLRI